MNRGWWPRACVGLLFFLLFFPFFVLPSQVIEFTSNGLRYQTLSRDGLTLMFAPLSLTVREFAVLQISFSNGSHRVHIVKPADFYYYTVDGRRLRGTPAPTVIEQLYNKAGRREVMKLQRAYEKALFGNEVIRSNNGYEQRRRNALASGPSGIKAAAAASAISFVRTELAPGDSTDGAVFFRNRGKPLGPGTLRAELEGGELFDFSRSLSAGPLAAGDR